MRGEERTLIAAQAKWGLITLSIGAGPGGSCTRIYPQSVPTSAEWGFGPSAKW